MDPSGLAKDAGAAIAENTAKSLVSPGDVHSLMNVERTVERLDSLIEQGQDDMAGNDLQALRDHVAQSKQTLEGESEQEIQRQSNIHGDGIQGLRQNSEDEDLAVRRLGDPGSDPALIALQTYRQLDIPHPQASRRNQFARDEQQEAFGEARPYDDGPFTQAYNSSFTYTPPADYGIDLETGKLRTGVMEYQEQKINKDKVQGVGSSQQQQTPLNPRRQRQE